MMRKGWDYEQWKKFGSHVGQIKRLRIHFAVHRDDKEFAETRGV
jgi:hypothetical protein